MALLNKLKFLADRNVGNLAKWLRLLGMDATFARDMTDSDILLEAVRENRILLTRDRALKSRAPSRVYLITETTLEAQVREVVQAFSLSARLKPLSRCVECNVPIREVSVEHVRTKVPPRVLASVSRFYRCPMCQKVFWEGSHTGRIKLTLKRILRSEHSVNDKMGEEGEP